MDLDAALSRYKATKDAHSQATAALIAVLKTHPTSIKTAVLAENVPDFRKLFLQLGGLRGIATLRPTVDKLTVEALRMADEWEAGTATSGDALTFLSQKAVPALRVIVLILQRAGSA